jgi:hypothetical protein
MIDQEAGDVYIPSSLEFASDASETVWHAMNSCNLVNWYGGRLGYVRDSKPDSSDAGVLLRTFGDAGPPAFFLDMLVSLDLEVPPADTVLRNLDAAALRQSYDAPAFNMPEGGDVHDIALCLAASRIVFECRDHVIVPTTVDRRDFVRDLAEIGLNALALGGVAVYPIAKAILTAPDFWRGREASRGDGVKDFGSDQ